jgi:hypothetical protein
MVDERPQTWGSALGRSAGYLLLAFGLLVGGGVLFFGTAGSGLVFTLFGLPPLVVGLVLLVIARTAEAKARQREGPPR